MTSPADQFTYVAVPSRPTVTGVAPNYGPRHGGVAVGITGTRFTGASSVRFGSKRARFFVKSATKIVARALAGKGTVHVTVTTPQGTSATSPADQFTYVAGPGIYSIKPTSGPAKGGTRVTITGFNLRGATKVRFGTKRAHFYTLYGDGKIIARSPAGVGTVDVRVTTHTGTSAIVRGDQYTYTGTALAAATLQIAAAVPTKTLATYAYDGDGLRVGKTTANGTNLFTWDVSEVLPHLLTDGQSWLIYGPAGLPVEQLDADKSVLYFLHDNLGSTRALLDSGGVVQATFQYTAFGEVSDTGTARTSVHYTGSFTDEETGHYYLVNRYYDPASAEFMTVDPSVNFTLSAYVYLNGNPVNWVDPIGLWPTWGTVLGAVSTVTGAVALGLAVTGVGAPAAAILEGVSVGTGIGAAYLDCREAVDVQCGIDVAAAGLGAAGLAAKGLSLIGRISVETGELTDTFLAIHAVHLGLAGTLVGLFKSPGDERYTGTGGRSPAVLHDRQALVC